MVEYEEVENMGKDATYKADKVYDNGQQWTDKLVGKSAMMKYMRKMIKLMENDRGRVNSVIISCVGRNEEDIEKKDEINYKTFANVNRNDTYKEDLEDIHD